MHLLNTETGHVVVLADVKFADRAGLASLEPPINAVSVEVMHARHCSNLLSTLVLHYADEALLVCLIFLSVQEFLSDRPLR